MTEEREMSAQREMNLEEWCGKLIESHAVNRQLRVLQHCREHPLKWAIWDFLRKYLPFINWKAPL